METEIQNDRSKPQSKRHCWLPLIVAPYIIGLTWHCLHPFVSVFTGDLNARRWYIDENSLDPEHFRAVSRYRVRDKAGTTASASSLCEAVHNTRRISCDTYVGLEIAQIVPYVGAIAPLSEAIVLVVPPSDDWNKNQFHSSFIELLTRLSTPMDAPWLAKTIIVVSPQQQRQPNGTCYTLKETVHTFLGYFLNSSYPAITVNGSFRGAIIRNLLVLSTMDNKAHAASDELRILPQGRRGILPNMDFVFLCTFMYSNARMSLKQNVVMHPYRHKTEEWIRQHLSFLPFQQQRMLRKLLDLLCFEYSLVMGPINPHASALNQGIDSLTIQFNANGEDQRSADLVGQLELVVRALSNLHERLHHSTALYLLASHERFVKHEEYLVPNLLLLVPCIIRAVTLVLSDIDDFCATSVRRAICLVLLVSLLSVFGLKMVELVDESMFQNKIQAQHSTVASAYLVLVIASSLYGRQSVTARRSVQFAACLLSIYVHVAIAFGHVSLAFPSALFWTPVIAFPFYSERSDAFSTRFVRLILLLLSCPFMWLIPNVFPGYIEYVRFGYLPLHVMLSVLWSP
jgi:glycosylphosphatidylinositol transamidase